MDKYPEIVKDFPIGKKSEIKETPHKNSKEGHLY